MRLRAAAQRRALLAGLTFMATLLVPRPAQAHLMNTGFGPFYDGLTHLFMTPEDLLPVVALTLLAGLRGPRCGRTVLFVLPLAWLVGTAAGFVVAWPVARAIAIATATVTIVLGALVAGDAPLPLAVVAGVAIALGLLHGGVNGVELAAAHSSVVSAVGVGGALFLVVSLGAGNVVSLRAPWTRLVVRVAGSWIAAIGLLILGWSVRGA